jgi:microcystin-dependent protein
MAKLRNVDDILTSDGDFLPSGVVFPYAGPSAPSGYLFCDGAEYSRTTYAKLYSIIGDTFGAGNGSTTFNVPDARQRFIIGKADAGTASVLGSSGGSIDHTHTTTAHIHDLQNHTHLGGSHTHGLASHIHVAPGHTHHMQNHTHGLNNHTHNVPAHKHDSNAPGATIKIIESGNHTHVIEAQWTSSTAHNHTASTEVAIGPSGASQANPNPITNNASHDHNNSTFQGFVGPSTGANGDAAFATDGPSQGSTTGPSNNQTGDSGNTNTSGPSTNTSDAGGSVSTGGPNTNNTGLAGSSPTSSNNPPYLVLNYIIKV